MRQRLSTLNSYSKRPSPSAKPYPLSIHLHLADLASHLSPTTRPNTALTTHSRSISIGSFPPKNRVYPSVRRPADLHTLLQSASSTNTLLLTLFKTSTCPSCTHITPLLSSIISSRPCPRPTDKYSSIAFAELELDSPERDDGGGRGWNTMYDVGIEYGVRSVPVLVGFGGRRAERVTDRLADERKLRDRAFMEEWIDAEMSKGDPSPVTSTGWFARIFGGG